MFHYKKNLRTCNDKEENDNKSHKKTYSHSRRKTSSKYSRHRKKKGCGYHKISFKHGDCESQFVASSRLTNPVGMLAKGKISDSISRLEKDLPKPLKARAEQDLHKVITFSNETRMNYLNAPAFKTSKVNNVYCKNTSFTSSSSSSNPSPPLQKLNNCRKIEILYSSCTENSIFSSKAQPSPENSMNKSSPILHSTSVCEEDELSLSREVITKELHAAVKCCNNKIFPGISNKDILKEEFILLKKQYNSYRKVFSNSDNCASSQENISDEKAVFIKENFKLNPILTQKSVAPKDLENLFPSIEDDASSGSDTEISDDQSPILQTKPVYENYISNNDTLTSSFEKLKQVSPNSSGSSSVWQPDVSPVIFVPDSPPTPKLFYRQKMF